MKINLTRLFCVSFLLVTQTFSQPFWNSGDGPYGGTILDFAFNSDGHIYGAGFYGLYRSADNGQNWETVAPNVFSSMFQLKTVAIDQMNNIYVGSFFGIFKSTDNGLTFNTANNGLPNPNINTIDVSPAGVLFAGSFSGVSRSTDGGANWVTVNNGLPQNISVQSFVFDNSSDEIFVGTSSGVFSSTDNGDNWTNISSGLPTNTHVTSLALSPATLEGGDYLYAGTSQGVHRFNRTLQTWLHMSTGLGLAFIYTLAVNSQGDIFAGTSEGIFRHLAAATQWTQLNLALIFSFVTALAVSPLGHIIASEDWGGPLLSIDNGNNWFRIITGLTAFGIISFYYSHILDKFFIGSDAGYFKGFAATWALMFPQTLPFFIATATVYSVLGYLFAGTFAQGILRSSDEGVSWHPANNGLTNLFITALVVTALGHLYAGTQGGGVFFSDNSGNSWVQINAGLTALLITTLYLSASGILFAGTTNAGIFRYDSISNTWTQLALTGLTTLYITAIVVNSLGDVFAGTSGGGVYKLLSGASSWVALGILVSFINDLIIRRNQLTDSNEEEILAATRGGIFYSTDAGDSWEELNDGAGGSVFATRFAADSSGGIYVAVNGGGIFKGGGGPNFINIELNTPGKFILNQNYPNPFNPNTRISWQSPAGSWQTLKVYDLLGREVATLVDEYKPSGSYEVEFDASDLSGGVYFYKLQAEGYSQTKKLLLLK